MKYKVGVGSFVTRMVSRNIIIHAQNEEEAKDKAIKEYIKRELELACSSDPGSPQVDGINETN